MDESAPRRNGIRNYRQTPEISALKRPFHRRAYIQRAADYDPAKRSFLAKYPGDAGESIRRVTKELAERIEAASRPVAEKSASATTAKAAADKAPAKAAKPQPTKVGDIVKQSTVTTAPHPARTAAAAIKSAEAGSKATQRPSGPSKELTNGATPAGPAKN